jgi:hypothetical protein
MFGCHSCYLLVIHFVNMSLFSVTVVHLVPNYKKDIHFVDVFGTSKCMWC